MNVGLAQAQKQLRGLVQTLLGREEVDTLRGRLTRGATGSFALKISATGLSFVVSVLLARFLGAEGYGIYAYALAWANLLGVLATLGLDRLLTREVAAYQTRSEWGLMRGLLQRANQAVLLVSLGLALGAAVVAALVFEGLMLSTFWLALVLLPLVALTNLRQAAMRGLHRVVLGQLPEFLVRPLLLILLVVGAYLALEGKFTASWAMGMHVVAAGAAFLMGAIMLIKYLPQTIKMASTTYQTRWWAQSALYLLAISAMSVINDRTPTLMLGAMKGTEAVGVYAVAYRGASLVSFVLFAINAILAPTIASLYASQEMQRLQRIITKSARLILALSLPIALGLLVFGDWLLLLFGPEFVQGRVALSIMSLGYLVNAAMGSVGFLLTMTGHERDVAIGIGLSAVMSVALNALLIPQWSTEGAALATALCMAFWNLLLAVRVRKRLGIYPTALGRIPIR